MRILRTSPITGEEHVQEIDVTREQLNAWHSGELIQNAMPNLTPDEREFIKTGITSDEWDTLDGGVSAEGKKPYMSKFKTLP